MTNLETAKRETLETEAQELTCEAMHLYLQNERNKLRFGAICRRMCAEEEGKHLYQWAGFKTFDGWLESVGDLKRSQAYHLRDMSLALENSVPKEVIPNLPLNNAEDLLRLPASKRGNPETLDLACKSVNSKFREHINKVHPGLHLERRAYKGFKMEESAIVIVEQALDLAMEQAGVESEGAALEYICADWLAGQNTPSEKQLQEAVKG